MMEHMWFSRFVRVLWDLALLFYIPLSHSQLGCLKFKTSVESRDKLGTRGVSSLAVNMDVISSRPSVVVTMMLPVSLCLVSKMTSLTVRSRVGVVVFCGRYIMF